jgi:large subunit ribosomal protein L33
LDWNWFLFPTKPQNSFASACLEVGFVGIIRDSKKYRTLYVLQDAVPPFTVTFFLPNMAKSKKKAETIFLVCEETGDYNYSLKRKPGGEKLRLLKYSPRLRKRTWHNEKKK